MDIFCFRESSEKFIEVSYQGRVLEVPSQEIVVACIGFSEVPVPGLPRKAICGGRRAGT